MKEPYRITRSKTGKEENYNALYEFLKMNGRPILIRSEGLTCKVYKNDEYLGTAELTTNEGGYGKGMNLYVSETSFDKNEITGFYATDYEPMEKVGNRLLIGCYTNPNRSEEYLLELEH